GEWYDDRATTNRKLYYKPRAGDDLTTAIAPDLETLVRVAGSAHDLTFQGLTFEHSTWTVPNQGYVGVQADIYYLGELVDPDNCYQTSELAALPGAISIANASAIRFQENVFRHLGATAINLRQSVTSMQIIGNKFWDISGSAISIDSVGTLSPDQCA